MKHHTINIKTFKIWIVTLVLSFPGMLLALGGGGDPGMECIDASPFCSELEYDFPNVSDGTVAPSGPNYGCLGSEPNPVWYYMEIQTSGVIQIHISQTSGQNGTGIGQDVDFAMWGPFTDYVSGCNQIMGGGLPPLQCSYSGSATENIGIGATGGAGSGQSTPPAAQAGEVYIVILTNYNGSSGYIEFNQTNYGNSGAGETDCSIVIPCTIENFTANVSACDNDMYSVDGIVEVSDAPDTGDLIVVDCNGNQTILASAPFTLPSYTYTLSNLNADGSPCDVEVYFTDEPNCSQTISYTAPTCDSPCFMSNIDVTIHPCEGDGTFEVTGFVEFEDAPATGQLIIEDCSGNTTTINAPFSSPTNFTVSGIDADGAACNMTAYFSSDPTCTIDVSYTNTSNCDCSAFIGTFTATGVAANATTAICYGDGFSIEANGDFIPAEEANNPPLPDGYDPGIAWFVFTCPPTLPIVFNPVTGNYDDPCFAGFIPGDDIGDINDLSFVGGFSGVTDNTLYFLPVTMYNNSAGYISYVNTDDPCFSYGNPYTVQYLTEVTETSVEDCLAGTVTTTVNGGSAEINGTNFTGSNLVPATATFDVQTASNGGTIVVSGLVDGDVYSYDIEDDAGCLITVSGTFSGAGASDFTYPNAAYCKDESDPTPTVTGESGGTFSSTTGLTINTSTGEIDLAASTAGTYTVTYASPGAPCNSESTFEITLYDVPAFTITSTDPTCGNEDGEIVITGLNGSTTYDLNYTLNGNPVGSSSQTTNGGGNITLSNLGFGVYSNFEITGEGDCSTVETSSIHLNPSDAPVVTAPDNIDICIGESFTLTAQNPDNATLSWNNGITDGVAFTPTSSGSTTYTVSATIEGCTATDEVTVTVHDLPNVYAGQDQDVCEGETATLTASGAASYVWNNGQTGANISVNPAQTTTYTVTGTSVQGCENTDNVTVTVYPYPEPSFTGDPLFGCSPHTVSFSNTTVNSANTTCLWEFGDGTTSTNCNPSHTYTSSGIYDVTLTVTNAIGCANTITYSNYVEVVPTPIASFTANPETVNTLDPVVNFFNDSENATDYIWNFGDNSGTVTTYNANHDYSSASEGQYVVSLIASNGMPECNDTAQVLITVNEDLIFYVPNTFTPDNDNYNEVFRPIFSSGYDPQSYTLEIFNRWGELLFESHNVDGGWDGTYGVNRDGIVKDGTYVWKIKIKETGKDKHNEYVGHVTVLR